MARPGIALPLRCDGEVREARVQRLDRRDDGRPLLTVDRPLYRIGSISALLLVIGYIGIIPLYVLVGAAPSGGEAKLAYFEGKTTAWWAIVALSVVTDLLWVPIALSLYVALGVVNRAATLIGVGLLLLFVVLDLAVTWPNYAALINLATAASGAAGAQRALYVSAATYAAVVVESGLEASYAIGVPSLGILIIGLAMLRGTFGRVAAYLGILTGIAGLIAVFGPFLTTALSPAAIVASLFTTVWFAIVGYRLFRMGR